MKTIDTEDFAKKVNNLRVNSSNRSFNKEEMILLFRTNGLPCSNSYFSTFAKYGIVVKLTRGKYAFPQEPIYVGVIQTALNDIRTYMLVANKNSLNKKNGEDSRGKIEEAINLLKSNGFLVFKPM